MCKHCAGKGNAKKFEEYEHHGTKVIVQTHLKGRHREHCLCWQSCGNLKAGADNLRDLEFLEAQVRNLLDIAAEGGRCPRATLLYAFCRVTGMTTPVWECSDYKLSAIKPPDDQVEDLPET